MSRLFDHTQGVYGAATQPSINLTQLRRAQNSALLEQSAVAEVSWEAQNAARVMQSVRRHLISCLVT